MSPAPLKSSIFGIVAPLISLVTYSVGHGLLSTLVTVRLSAEEVSPQWIGFVSAAYFAGLIAGTFINTKLILGVGHIRAYAAYASILASTSLLFGLAVYPEFWLFLRLIGGFATGGLFVVIESWLMASTSAKVRGQVLGVYMVLLYAAMAGGQMILKWVDIMMLIPFALAALAASLSVIPLSLLKSQLPEIEDHGRLPFKRLFKLTPSGVMASFCGGLLLGVVYGLLPLFFSSVGYDVGDTANMMAVVIVGGMCMQYPLGRISDRYDRRMVIAFLFGLTMVLATAFIWMNAIDNQWMTAVFIFLFGGVMFSIYPISLSHACDELPPEQVINGNQGVLLSYSLGAMIGPMLAPWFMSVRGPMGVFVYFTTVSALIVVYLLWRRTVRSPVPIEAHNTFTATVPTSPLIAEMDPRGDPEIETTMASHDESENADQEVAAPSKDGDEVAERTRED
ncbi:MFS transporter [Hahella sp. CCB-MM4]|uniref:MFS transporter n=1 Tax=Hahella sp. (strain CCB-MM4) TaxID=1926491 RepID=UPI000B9AAEC2|nr:MFS transporter [Hahella sp. CCB-MM4]OZG74420.1 MFS transporter [Hahella sp. CCB-MM4]